MISGKLADETVNQAAAVGDRGKILSLGLMYTAFLYLRNLDQWDSGASEPLLNSADLGVQAGLEPLPPIGQDFG